MYDLRDELGVPNALVEAFVDDGLIRESQAKLITTSVQLLNEANPAPNELIVGDKIIKMETFRNVWTNFDQYWDIRQVLLGLGLEESDFGNGGRRSVTRKLPQLVMRAYEKGYLDRPVKFSEREEAYSNLRQRNQESGETATSRDPEQAIDRGERGKDNSPTGRTVNKINDTEVLPGEFYSNISHIPKSTQKAWWKLWSNKKRQVPSDGKQWRKSFIVGYQLNQNTMLEVWYNTIDSTFSIHNQRGVQVSRRLPTVKEAMYNMLEMIKTYSENVDTSIRSANNNQIFSSISRTLSNDVSNSPQLRRLRALERRDKRQYEKDRKDKKRRQAEKAEEDAAFKQAARDYKKDTLNRMQQAFKDMEDQKNKRPKNDEQRKARNDAINRATGKSGPFNGYATSNDADAASKAAQDSMSRNGAGFEDDLEELKRKQRERRQTFTSRGGPADDDYGIEGEYLGKNGSDSKELAKYQPPMDISRQKALDFYDIADSVDSIFSSNGMSLLTEEEDAIAQYYKRIGELRAKEEKQNADNSAYTKAILNTSAFEDLIEQYDTTRVKQKSWLSRSVFRNVGRGRVRRRSTPDLDASANSPFRILRVQNNGNSFISNKYIADFLIGFSLKGVADIEVWYVSEPNPNFDKNGTDPLPEMISSYYVYDITSQLLLRSYLPYYRNAIQVVVDKLSPRLNTSTKTKKNLR